MHIIFAIVRHIEIDNKINIIDIYSAAEDIRCHEHGQPAAAELYQNIFSSDCSRSLCISHGLYAIAFQVTRKLFYI